MGRAVGDRDVERGDGCAKGAAGVGYRQSSGFVGAKGSAGGPESDPRIHESGRSGVDPCLPAGRVIALNVDDELQFEAAVDYLKLLPGTEGDDDEVGRGKARLHGE